MERRRRQRRIDRGRRQADFVGSAIIHLLVIDPHDDTRVMYAMMLAEANYVVYGAADGRSAVLLAEHRLPDVILSELVVPGLDGFGIRQALEANPLTKHIPMIAVTGLLHSGIPDLARRAGFAEVLAKPVEPVDLLRAVVDNVAKTPADRLLRRRLRRALLTLRKLGTHLKDDPSAQERVRKLIDRLQVAVLAFDDTGRYVAASPAVSSLTGYSRTQILSRSIFEAPLVDPPADMQQRWGDFMSLRQCAVAGTMRDAAGAIIDVQAAFVTILPGLHAAAIAPAAANHAG